MQLNFTTKQGGRFLIFWAFFKLFINAGVNNNLPEEIELSSKYPEEHSLPQPPEGEFFTERYDKYEKMRERLIDCIPDFRLRLKVNPHNNQFVFSAGVNFVFDIGWYVLVRMMSKYPASENIGKEDEQPEEIMICCHHYGRFFNTKCQTPAIL